MSDPTTKFVCDTCSHVFTDVMPWFAPCYACRVQGCRGTAEPQDLLPLRGLVRTAPPDSKRNDP